MYIPMTLAIWRALCKIGAPQAGELHALLGGVDQLSKEDIGAIRWWRRLAFGTTVPLSILLMFISISLLLMGDIINKEILFSAVWFFAVFMPTSVLIGAGWVLTLKTASVAA
jgi:hypothetical protein